jgi:hypothetical protein
VQKQAEEERKAAEIKALEVAALKKQIAALEEAQLKAIEDERRTAEEAVRQSEALSKEIERLKSEREAEGRAVQDQLSGLKSKLEKLEQPWWKKIFGLD